MADEKTPALELTKTIQVDGQEFNVNAKAAEHVENPLTIYKSNLNKKATELLKFDGSVPKSIDIVPASGGSFAGRITVPPVSNSTLKADGETVLNYNDIVNNVVDKLLNTSAMATWNGEKLTFTDTVTPAIHGICVVAGAEEGVKAFAVKNHDNMLAATDESSPDLTLKWLPNYIYICVVGETGNEASATGSLYFGSADSTEVVKLVPGRGSAIIPGSIYIDKTRWIIPKPDTNAADYATYGSSGIDMHNSDLTNIQGLWCADSSDGRNEGIIFLRNQDGMDNFDLAKFYDKQGNRIRVVGDRLYANKEGKLLYDQEIWYYDPNTGRDFNQLNKDGVNNNKTKDIFHSGMIIPEVNGGTGQADLDNVTVGNAKHADSAANADKATLASNATTADKATKATQDSDGKQINTNYYRCNLNTTKINTITISTGNPSGGENGDIWIKY